jgi:hypothetical protein
VDKHGPAMYLQGNHHQDPGLALVPALVQKIATGL